jgi:L,D-transpeptidase YcbB
MKNLVLSIMVVLFSLSNLIAHINEKNYLRANEIYFDYYFQKNTGQKIKIHIDNAVISGFFKKYSNLKKYKSEVGILYKKRSYKPIWHDSEGLIEFANLLYSKVNQIEQDGLKSELPYKDTIDSIFDGESSKNLSPSDTELLLTTMYVYYAKNVFHGIDDSKTQELGWFIPRKNISYENLLDSLLVDPVLLNKNESRLFTQYYKLREVLKKYRQIEQNGDWTPITPISLFKEFKPNDSSKTIGQIRHRLAVMGDLKNDSKSNLYDKELMAAILNYKSRNGFNLDYTIESKHIDRMNIPIAQYIKTIIVNMERCRWIDPKITQAQEFIIINIPAFKLLYKKNGETVLESKLFVGKVMNETVVFSSKIDKIIFSPYWNIPKSIVDYELKYDIEQDENYLAKHNIEWNNGNARQKPGPNNALGLVKFVFPNSNSIYLHDTPSKNLFEYEYRAFSHGCINLKKAKELAEVLLIEDPDWPVEKINDAMKGEKETVCILKKKVPIHIGYLTTWVNDMGEINFYPDIYSRDNRLYQLLFPEVIE